MSDPNINQPAGGIIRIRPGDEPRNHHGDPAAPLTPDGKPYAYAWTTDRGDTVYAATADHLLDVWIPGYLELPASDRDRLRAEHAVRARTEITATLAAAAGPDTLSAEDETVLLADLADMPDVDTWNSSVPLVLLEGMYRPFTDRSAPLSGIDGDVRDPSNIIWLRHSSSDAYVESLARAGYIQLAVR